MKGRIYLSSKTYTHAQGLSCAFRQWRAESHCRFLHGYALQVRIEFIAHRLDARNWVVDFGGMKDIKRWLEDSFDHKTIVAHDDPKMATFLELEKQGLINLRLTQHVGMEAFAEEIFDYCSLWTVQTQSSRVQVEQVEVREHDGNSAIVRRSGEQ